ncbi:hypothetical protein ASG89_20940 [Paenibacillus sp. Soil766]|uniref:spore germination protein n=1 Tax=Paenibacillus sp. Soil766 TaxID=1736404 RepID=UPI00070A92BE|nr:spore germination protein [Paenibacillus sp. Soil766]KRF04773.1 hypothetical protein ASG89_20940 [Paenibacillus sp. Soil766]
MLSIAASREAVPFPAMFEALIMEIIFEALREAGIRLPKQIAAFTIARYSFANGIRLGFPCCS